MTRQTQRYCRHDDRLVMAIKDTPKHILHLILSIVTCGLWLPIWFLVSLKHNPYRCPHCGSKTDGVWLFDKIQKQRRKAERQTKANAENWTDDFARLMEDR